MPDKVLYSIRIKSAMGRIMASRRSFPVYDEQRQEKEETTGRMNMREVPGGDQELPADIVLIAAGNFFEIVCCII